MRTSIRWLLLIYAAAIAAVAVLAWLAFALPIAGGTPGVAVRLVAISLLAGGVVLVAATVLLVRGLARPIDRLFAAAARLGSVAPPASDDLPILGEPGTAAGPWLDRAAVAFERLADALRQERARLAAKLEELTQANRSLREARESWLRSEKLATVGRLAAGVAHEVGNPLGAVKGYAALARSRLSADASPEVVDAVARIESAAERIDRTLRDLLEFARPVPPLLGPIDLAAVCESSLRLAQVQERFRRVAVEVTVPPDLPPVVADEHHLAQVLVNLFLNAGDAMGGEGRVRVSASPDGEDTVVVTIEDCGPGISPEHLPQIFDPFFTTKDPGAGTGLGLAISHRIVESFGGEISARSLPGGGAVFELRLASAATRGAC